MIEWTGDAVLWRLIEAYRVIESTTLDPRPRAGGSTMPNPIRFATEGALYAFELEDQILEGGRAMALMKEAQRDAIEDSARRNASAEAISMALEAQRWPIDILTDFDKRTCLMAYALCRSRNGDWSKTLQRRNRKFATKRAWIRRTTYRWNEQSLQRIAEVLQQNGTMCREAAALPVTHEPVSRACQPGRTERHAWRAERWQPVLPGR